MPHNLLLCDDEVHILRAAEFKFKRAGFEVRTAFDGKEGWELIQQQRPDVVVTDYQMPRLDGLGLIERIRTTPETADIPVVLLTAKGFELPREELAERLKVSALLPKPFSPRRLLQCVVVIVETGKYAEPAAAPGNML